MRLDPVERQVKRVYEQYQKDLFANNALDFGEIITMPYRLLRDHPEVRAKYQQRFRYIHVDEYQDTNALQADILNGLKPAGCGLTVVGDDAQSIYSFRSATIRNILDFPARFDPPAAVVKLEQNYRSTQPILAACNQVIHRATQGMQKTLFSIPCVAR